MSINLKDVYLEIPVYLPGSDRILKRPQFLTKSVGANVNLSVKAASIKALNGINLDVQSGVRVGLFGHNGAGKTTLLKVIAGILPVSSGHLEVKGTIGCLLGNTTFSNELTGSEIIKYYCKIHYPEFDFRSLESDIIDFTELGDYIHLPARVYSNGMRARLYASLSIAMARDILLIDEGIGAGDLSFQKKFSERLDSFLKSSSTLLIASHSIDLLKEYCDIGVILNRGSVIFQGDIKETIDYYRGNVVS